MIWCVTFGVFGHFQIYRAAVTISAMPHSQPPQNKNEPCRYKNHHKKISWATKATKKQK